MKILLRFALFITLISIAYPAIAAKLSPLSVVQGKTAHNFKVEVVDTPEGMQQGLMNRESLAKDRGMLFVLDDPKEAYMWMKDTLIPLDMVFIKADGTIHRIEENTTPKSLKIIRSGGDVKYVLELPGGSAKRLKLKAGDMVKHPRITP